MPMHRGPIAALTLLSCCAFGAQASTDSKPSFHALGSTSKPAAAAQVEQPEVAELPSVQFEMKVHYHQDGRVEMRCEQAHSPARGDSDGNRQEKQK